MAEPRDAARPGGGRTPPGWITVVILFVAALVLLRLLGPGGEGKNAPPPVAGRILNPDGTPAPSLVVEAALDPGGGAPPLTLRSPPTGPDGKFVVPGAPKTWASLRLQVRKGPLVIEADLGDAKGPLDLSLSLPATFTVAGIVVAAEMGRPLPEMDVRFGVKKTRTDELGRFRFPDLPASMTGHEAPVLEVTGKGRKTLQRRVSWEDGVDDILLNMELDGPR